MKYLKPKRNINNRNKSCALIKNNRRTRNKPRTSSKKPKTFKISIMRFSCEF